MIEDWPFGRIVVPERLPDGKALFYTTIDFDGRLNDGVARGVTDFLARRFGIEAQLNTCTQVHGATVVGVRRQSRRFRMRSTWQSNAPATPKASRSRAKRCDLAER